MAIDYGNWKPYYPVGYPITDGIHNPWVTLDPISGDTGYRIWVKHGRPTDTEEFTRTLDRIREGNQ